MPLTDKEIRERILKIIKAHKAAKPGDRHIYVDGKEIEIHYIPQVVCGLVQNLFRGKR